MTYDPDKVWDDRADKAYQDFTRHPWLTVLGWTAGLFAVVGIIVLIGWQANWWFTTQNAKRQGTINNINAHNYRNGYDFQQTLRSSIASDIEGVLQIAPQMAGQSATERTALSDQRLSQLNTLCQDASQITGDPLPSSQRQFVSANCEAGTVKPSSPYETHKDQPTP